jgi:hypothetical protein
MRSVLNDPFQFLQPLFVDTHASSPVLKIMNDHFTAQGKLRRDWRGLFRYVLSNQSAPQTVKHFFVDCDVVSLAARVESPG